MSPLYGLISDLFGNFPAELARLTVQSVSFQSWAILAQLQTSGMGLLVLGRRVITVPRLGAGQRNSNSHRESNLLIRNYYDLFLYRNDYY